MVHNQSDTVTPLLQVCNLVKHYPFRHGKMFTRRSSLIRAMENVSFNLHPGQTIGLVGESGCGKSTLAKVVTRLIEPTSGEVLYQGRNIFDLSREDMRQLRKDIQIVFQDPYSSLNPRMTVAEIIGESWRVFPDILPRSKWSTRIGELLTRVGLHSSDAGRFPHQFSGGQRQRIGIARALASNPKVIICDEPVSALDASVQAQVINLLEDIQAEYGLSYIFIAHDLSVVRHISDQVIVMYLGKIIEYGDTDKVYGQPTHPYSQALLSAVPLPDPMGRHTRRAISLSGDVPSPIDPPSGCSFRPRCWKATEECAAKEPALREVETGVMCACHYPEATKIV